MAGQSIIVSVLADTKNFSSSMKKLSDTTGLTKLTNGIKKAGKAGIALGTVVTGLAIKGGISRALNIEDARAALTGLGHDTKAIDKIMQNALASVKGTSFGLGDAATIASTAVAAGIEPGKELERVLRLTANSAALARVDLSDMGSILNKVWTAGRVQTQELNQLADRGIPIWTKLAEHYGVNAVELRKMVSQGKVDAETFANVLEGTVGNAAEEMGKTTRGAWQNMLAALSRVGEQLISGVFPKVKEFFAGVMEWADKVAPYAERAGAAIGNAVSTAVQWLQDNALPVLQRFADWIVGTLVPALVSISNWIRDTGLPALQSFGNWIKDNIFPYFQDIANVITGHVLPALQNFIGEMRSGEGEGGKLARTIGAIITGLKNAVTWLVQNRDLVWKLVGAYAAWKTAQGALKLTRWTVELGKTVAAKYRLITATIKSGIEQAKWMAFQVKWVAWNTKNFLVALAKGAASIATTTALWIKDTAAMAAHKTAQLATAAATKVATGAQALFNAAMNANPIMKVVTALGVVAAALTYFFTQTELGRAIWQGFVDFLAGIWEWIVGVAEAVWGGITEFFSSLWSDITGGVTKAWGSVRDFFARLWKSISDPLFNAWNAVRQFFADLWDTLKKMVSNTWDFIKKILGWHPLALIVNNWDSILNWFKALPGKIASYISGLWDNVKHGFMTAKRNAQNLWDDLLTWFKNLPGKIGNAFRNIWDVVSAPFKRAFNKIAEFWNNTVGQLNWSVPSWVPGIGGKSVGAPKLPMLAKGGTALASGWSIIGERGPELLHLPRGASVVPLGHPASNSALPGDQDNNSRPTIVTLSKEAIHELARAIRDGASEGVAGGFTGAAAQVRTAVRAGWA